MNARDLRRQATGHKERRPCYVCGRHQAITEFHHVFSLRDWAVMFPNVQTIEIPMAWLCPNCHTYIHQMHKGIFYNAIRELPEDEYARMIALINLRDEVIGELIREVFG